MTSILPVTDRSEDRVQGGYLAPPHGLKDELEELPLVTPQSLFVFSGLIFLTVMLFFCGSLILRSWLKKSKNGGRSVDAGQRTTNWARLKDEIQKLEMSSVSAVEFASGVSLCLRRAIEIKTELPLAERTSEEIIQILKDEIVHGLSKDDVISMLLRLDALRFAGLSMESGEEHILLEQLKNAVNKLEDATQSTVVQPGGVVEPLSEKGQIFD
jgi:hypothetical protein